MRRYFSSTNGDSAGKVKGRRPARAACGAVQVVDRLARIGDETHVAGHVQLAALLVRDVLESALAIDVPCPHVRRIDREPNPLEAEFVGQIDAASHQFGADAEVLKSGADDDQHFALLLVDGKQGGMADDRRLVSERGRLRPTIADDAAITWMPVTSMSRTQRTQTSSLIGGSPWKEFRGWKARYMSISRWPASAGRRCSSMGKPFLPAKVRGRQRTRRSAAEWLIERLSCGLRISSRHCIAGRTPSPLRRKRRGTRMQRLPYQFRPKGRRNFNNRASVCALMRYLLRLVGGVLAAEIFRPPDNKLGLK